MGKALDVLVVEDNADDRELAILGLRRGGYDPVWQGVKNADELEEALCEKSWDLVLCDYALPGFSGIEALRLIRAVHRLDVPVVCVSGTIGDETAVELIKGGAQDYVLKGNFTRLGHAVDSALAAVQAKRKKIELDRLLDHERQLLAQLMTNIPAAIYFKDRQLRYTHVNLVACRMLGATDPAEVLGQTADLIVDDARAKQMRAEEEEIFAAGKAMVDRIEQVTLPDGSTRWYSATKAPIRDDDGTIIGLVGFTRDVTKRITEERKRAEMEAWIREVLYVAPDAIIATDHDRKIIVFNSSAERIFGYQAEEIIGRPVDALLPAVTNSDFPEHAAELEQSEVAGPHMGARRDIGGRRKNGEKFPAEVSLSRFTLNGNATLIAAVRDVSAQEMMRADNERLEKSLRQAEKMQSLGTLAGGIAHEFNNLLTPIQLLSELSLDDAPPDSRLAEQLSTILANSRRAAEMVERILAFSRTDSSRVERRELRLSSVVDETLTLLRKTLPSSIRIHREFDDFDDRIVADETQLHQVLMNLGGNAAHAMEGKVGDLTFALKCCPTGSKSGRGGEAVLTVRDTGCGMDEETRNRIFEPFFTTKPVGEGTGMGLSIIHGIVESHAGSIRVESVPGQGTAFHVHLPLMGSGTTAGRRQAGDRI